MYQVMEPIRSGSEEINHNHVILVIDDDHAVRNSLKFTLEVEGFKVRAYSDPRELLNEGSLPPFSCLVIDYTCRR
jgi:FixJ family two-component response regulator